MHAENLAENYRGYKGIPELVGLLTMKEAINKGLSVAESVERLKRYHWAAKRLSLIFTSRIASTAVYELKMAFSLHAHYLAEHTGAFFNRVREMREPPYGMDTTPHQALDLLLDEVQNAPTVEAFVLGVYDRIIPAFIEGLERHIAENNKLFDHPTYRVCRFALIELQDIEEYGRKVVAALIDPATREAHQRWLNLLDNCLAAMGGLDGAASKTDGGVAAATNDGGAAATDGGAPATNGGEAADKKADRPNNEAALQKMYSATPFRYDGVPTRDERFVDLYNRGVNAEAFLLDRNNEPLPKTIMLYFKRMREIDVPEMMSSIIYETGNKPWDYYKDMIRQVWDEARHAMMGEVGFTSINVDWTTIPLNHTWSYLLNTKMKSIDRHAILYFIEQGLMPAKTGKQYEWEVAVATANKLTALIQDYDWADEVLHARIGRDWLVPELGGQKAAMDYGSNAWSEALVDTYDEHQEQGLTQHENWWPRVYEQACRHWGVTPNPAVLAYNTTYRNSRADQKELKTEKG